MRTVLLICMVGSAVACDAGTRGPEILGALNHATLETSADTIQLRPPLTQGLGPPYPGTRLDTSTYVFFATFYPELADIRDLDGVAGLFRVRFGRDRIGYVLRVPSQYSSTAADLLVYNRRSREWEPPVRLADSYGDGCWYFIQYGWLVDVDADGHADVVRRYRETWIDDSLRAREADSLWVLLGHNAGFGEPIATSDTLLRQAFDVPGWVPMRDDSC